MEYYIIITAPHSYCDYYSLDLKEKHYCDYRAEEAAKILYDVLQDNNIKCSLFINKETPRIFYSKAAENIEIKPKEDFCDLNRLKCRDHEWRQNIRNNIDELKKTNNYKIFVFDIHSFPNVTSFGGGDVSILNDTPKNLKMNKITLELFYVINKSLIKNGNYCNLLYGINNDIIDEANEMKIDSMLLEILEDKDRLTDDTIKEMYNNISLYLKSNKNKKYKLING